MNAQALVEQIGWTLVHTMWQGVVVAAVLMLVLRVMRCASASARYIASCAAMMLVVAAAGATFYAMRPAIPKPRRP